MYMPNLVDKNSKKYTNKAHHFNWKVFILPRVAELLNHKEKHRGCPLLDANKHTHIYTAYKCVVVD